MGSDKPTVRVVLGWVEQPVVKPHGGRAQTRASNIKDAAAERLESLVNGTAVGRGVENTDTLKAGDLMPVERLESVLARIGALRARIDAALQGTAETDAKARAKGDLVGGLRRRLADAKTEAGQHEEALKLYQGAHEIMGVPTTGIEVGRAQIALGSRLYFCCSISPTS